MPNIQPSSRIPGERISKEAQKIEKVNAIKTAVANAKNAATAGAVAAGAMGVGAAAGAAAGGILGGLMGGVLKLPNQQTYKIQPGDNLTYIAKLHLGPTADGNQIEKFVNEVLDLNEDIIANPHELYSGDTIALPAQKAAGNAAPTQKFLED